MCSKWSKLVYRNSESVSILEVGMRLQSVYRMSDIEVVEFLVGGNTTSNNHFMNFLDLLKAIWYPIIILLISSCRDIPSYAF